jgi:hypothetical protein
MNPNPYSRIPYDSKQSHQPKQGNRDKPNFTSISLSTYSKFKIIKTIILKKKKEKKKKNQKKKKKKINLTNQKIYKTDMIPNILQPTWS